MYHSANHDSLKIKALSIISGNMRSEFWKKYLDKEKELITILLSQKNLNNSFVSFLYGSLADILNDYGYHYFQEGAINKALTNFIKSIKIRERMNDMEGVATNLNNIGFIYKHQGNIVKALDYYHRCLKIQESLKDQKYTANSLNNIAVIYEIQNDFEKALEYHFLSLNMKKKQKDDFGIATSVNNIGNIYHHKGDLEVALKYYKEGLTIYDSINNVKGMASTLHNIGSLYETRGESDTALIYYEKCLEMEKNSQVVIGTAQTLVSIGEIYLKKNNINEAKRYGDLGMQMGKEMSFPSDIRDAANLLSQVYEKLGKGMKALEMYKLHVQMKDSINNEETQKASIRQQTQYEFEKAQIVKENEAKEQARLESEATGRRNNLQYSLIFLGILLLFVGILLMGFIKVSPNIAEGIIFFAFLILFEFILVFTDPYLEKITHEEPMYNLAANALIALLIFPLHAILEKLLKNRIVKS